MRSCPLTPEGAGMAAMSSRVYGILRRLQQPDRGALLHDAPLPHDDDAIAEQLHHMQIVGDEKELMPSLCFSSSSRFSTTACTETSSAPSARRE